MTRQRDEALRRINPLPAQPPQSNLTADQIATKIDVWASIDQQMNSLARILNEGYSMLDTWVSNSRSDHAAATKRAQALAESVSQYRAQLDNLRRTYIEFPDIAETLKEAINPPGRPTEDSTIFDRLLRSTGGFAQELGSLGDPLPENLENVMRARAGAVRRDLNAVREWQSKTRTAAANSINQLQK
jgi:hypothetical protein